ncbi:MAG TPA: DUF3276 family protein [Bacteroidia bacterium]|nr:DUF3276 family protein [Bacteroidia bacterium]
MSDRGNYNDSNSEDLFSKSVRAGKRTYFFDVRATKANDYYLTITESKKKFQGSEPGGKAVFEKHKIFLYKEDFTKFMEGLNEAVAEIKRAQPFDDSDFNNDRRHDGDSSYSNVDFDDLK